MYRTRQPDMASTIAQQRKELEALKSTQFVSVSNMYGYSKTVTKTVKVKGQTGYDVVAKYKFNGKYTIGTISVQRGYGDAPIPDPAAQVVQSGNGKMVAYSWLLGGGNPDSEQEATITANAMADMPGELTIEVNQYNFE